MTTIQKDTIIDLVDKYNNTDRMTIKKNLLDHIKISDYNRDSQKLADMIGVSVQTIYSYRKMNKGNVPDFTTALKLTKVLNITINDLLVS